MRVTRQSENNNLLGLPLARYSVGCVGAECMMAEPGDRHHAIFTLKKDISDVYGHLKTMQ